MTLPFLDEIDLLADAQAQAIGRLWELFDAVKVGMRSPGGTAQVTCLERLEGRQRTFLIAADGSLAAEAQA